MIYQENFNQEELYHNQQQENMWYELKEQEEKVLNMEFERVYRGVVTNIEKIYVDTFGTRTLKVHFKTGYCIYQHSTKRLCPFLVGDTIRFTGHFVGAVNSEYFFIKEIMDSDYLDQTAFEQPLGKRIFSSSVKTFRQ